MSSTYYEDGAVPDLFFHSVNGDKLIFHNESRFNLDSNTQNIIKFILHKEKTFNVNTSLLLLCTSVISWQAFESFVPFIVSAFAFALYCCYFVTAVNKDTLLAIESVGIHIKGQKSNSCQFIPWNTITDVVINEVITGQRVLYYLTIIIKESVAGEDSIKLIPLFQELKPERKCLEYMYVQLASLIGSSKGRREH